MKRTLLIFLIMCMLVFCIPMTAFFNSNSQSISSDSSQSESGSSSNTEEQTVKLLRTGTGQVVDLKMSDYIKGVVAAEIPMDYEAETIKAQAVAAHTYVLRMLETKNTSSDSSLNGADLSDNPSQYQAYVSEDEFNKMYGDKAADFRKKLDDAVGAVINKVMLYNDEPIAAAFHAMSSGKTESAQVVWGSSVSYLVPVDSASDKSAKSYEKKTTIPYSQLTDKLKATYPDITFPTDKSAMFQVKTSSDSGTVTEVQAGSATITGTALRSVLSLPSADFKVEYTSSDDSYVFTTYGMGHGVGMSQYGANQMALEGKSYEDILNHYYTGVAISG